MKAAKNFLFLSIPSDLSSAEFEEVLVSVENNNMKAMGNPYPRRGQIKKRIFGYIGDWIVSVSSVLLPDYSGECAAPEFRGGKGNPYPKRGEIKVRIFNDWFHY